MTAYEPEYVYTRRMGELIATTLKAWGLADHVTVDGLGIQPATDRASAINVRVVRESMRGSPVTGAQVTIMVRLEVLVTGWDYVLPFVTWLHGRAYEILMSDSGLRRELFAKFDSQEQEEDYSDPKGGRVAYIRSRTRVLVEDHVPAGALIGLVDNIRGEVTEAAQNAGTVIATDDRRRIMWVDVGTTDGPKQAAYMFTGATLGDTIEIRDAAGTLIESTTATTAPTGQQTTSVPLPAGQYFLTIAGVSAPLTLYVTEPLV